MPEHGLSNHPVDLLIRELIATRRNVEPDEIGRILDRIATTPFDPRVVRVPTLERGLGYGARRLLPWDDSLFIHLVRRVVLDRQWSEGTTAEQYVQDIRAAVRADHVTLAVYARRGGSIAAVLAPTHLAVPASRRGVRARSELVVVYSADRGIIVTGYQVPSRSELAIPEDALWLR